MGTDTLITYNSPEEYVSQMRAALWDANRNRAIQLAQQAIKHKNRWVGIRNGELVAEAGSLKELIELVGDDNNKDVLITPIY